MHEVSLMENALAIALDYAARDGARRIDKLSLRVGPLAGVEPSALQFAFDIVTQDTLAAGARLEIIDSPIRCYCSSCCREFTPLTLGYECPRCHTWSATVLQGQELELASLEVS